MSLKEKVFHTIQKFGIRTISKSIEHVPTETTTTDKIIPQIYSKEAYKLYESSWTDTMKHLGNSVNDDNII